MVIPNSDNTVSTVSLDRPSPHFMDEKLEASETILGSLYSITGFHQACILVLNNIGHRMWVSPENLLFTQKPPS